MTTDKCDRGLIWTYGRIASVAIILGTIVSGCVTSEPPKDVPASIAIGDTPLGAVLTTASGMTLYTLTSDPDGQSNCIKRCARSWPPLFAEEDARPTGDFSIFVRPDGKLQWAYRNRAIYLWKKDKKPGDVTGHAKGDVWYAARP